MGIFSRSVSAAEIGNQIQAFDAKTAAMSDRLEKLQRKVAGALARGEAADRLIREAAEVRVAIDSRPLARQALAREHRRALRAERAAVARAEQAAARAWAGKMMKLGERLGSTLGDFFSALDAWRAAAQAAPAGTGPVITGVGSNSLFVSSLRLGRLAEALRPALEGREPAASVLALLREAVEVIGRQADGAIAERLRKLESEEAADPELLLDEPAPQPPAAGEGGQP